MPVMRSLLSLQLVHRLAGSIHPGLTRPHLVGVAMHGQAISIGPPASCLLSKEMTMKPACVVAAVALFMTGAASANSAEFRFSGEVKSGDLSPLAFGLSVEARHMQVVDGPAGLKLEVSAPRDDGPKAEYLVRLLKAVGGHYQVLHEAKTIGSSAQERSFSYLVCGSEVTFITPAPQVTPLCK